jgi:hypothetical protein
MTRRRVIVGALVALALSAAFNVPHELNRHHHASHRVSVQVMAAVVVDIIFALLLWLLFLAILWVATRGSRGPRRGGDGPSPAPGGRPDSSDTRATAESAFGKR